jgi:hypothetical protein
VWVQYPQISHHDGHSKLVSNELAEDDPGV